MIETGPIEAYRKRWEAISAQEAAEWQHTPIAVRWRQLNSVIALAEGLGLDWRWQDRREVDQVRRRWVRLKEAYVRRQGSARLGGTSARGPEAAGTGR